uniref:Uncharacterized protein n=1 Tax=Oryza barthii TaxID=65489 RepID=A0A0D3FY04_9ORYZ
MNWIGRKIHIYNVTVGLYMLDWWERYLFNILMLCLLWYILRSFRSVNLSHCDDGAKLPAAATSLAIRDGEPHRCRFEVAPLAIEGLARPSSPGSSAPSGFV